MGGETMDERGGGIGVMWMKKGGEKIKIEEGFVRKWK